MLLSANNSYNDPQLVRTSRKKKRTTLAVHTLPSIEMEQTAHNGKIVAIKITRYYHKYENCTISKSTAPANINVSGKIYECVHSKFYDTFCSLGSSWDFFASLLSPIYSIYYCSAQRLFTVCVCVCVQCFWCRGCVVLYLSPSPFPPLPHFYPLLLFIVYSSIYLPGMSFSRKKNIILEWLIAYKNITKQNEHALL